MKFRIHVTFIYHMQMYVLIVWPKKMNLLKETSCIMIFMGWHSSASSYNFLLITNFLKEKEIKKEKGGRGREVSKNTGKKLYLETNLSPWMHLLFFFFSEENVPTLWNMEFEHLKILLFCKGCPMWKTCFTTSATTKVFWTNTKEFQLLVSSPWLLLFIIRLRHQLVFGVGRLQKSNLLFDNKRFYLLS